MEQGNNLQYRYFESRKHRYNRKFLLNPPVHTQVETGSLINKIPRKFYDGEVVDFGSGNGRLTIPLLKSGFRVKAVDVIKKSLKELTEISKNLGYKVRTYQKLESIGKANVVVGCDILHHIGLKKYSEILYKTLEEDGVMVFSEPGAMNPFWYFYITLFADWKVEKGLFQCSLWNLNKTFKNAGFRKVEISGMGLFPRALFQNRFLCRLNDALGDLPFIKYFAYRYLLYVEKY